MDSKRGPTFAVRPLASTLRKASQWVRHPDLRPNFPSDALRPLCLDPQGDQVCQAVREPSDPYLFQNTDHVVTPAKVPLLDPRDRSHCKPVRFPTHVLITRALRCTANLIIGSPVEDL